MSKEYWMGRIAIYCGNDKVAPVVVYVDDALVGKALVAHALNEGSFYFVDESDLLEFNFRLFNRLRSEWKLVDLKRQVDMIEKRRSL